MSDSIINILTNNIYLLKIAFLKDRFLIINKILISFLSSLIVAINILIPKYLLEAIIQNNINHVFQIIITYSTIMLLYNIIIAFLNYIDSIKTEKLNIYIVDDFLSKSSNYDLKFFDNKDFYNEYMLSLENSCAVVQQSINIFKSICTATFQILFLSSLLIWVNYYIIIVILIFVIIRLTLNNIIKKKSYLYEKQLLQKNREVNYIYKLFYTPNFFKEIKVNELKDFILNKKVEIDFNIINILKDKNKKLNKLSFLQKTIDLLEYVFITIYFAYSALLYRISVTEYFTSIYAYQKINESVLNLLNSYNELLSNSLYAKHYINFTNNKSITTNDHEGVIISHHEIISIEFKNVSFTYPNSNKNSLKNINFIINKGQKIGIVGKNGAGKTTIIKLLLRLYEPDTGEILLNGINLKEYNAKHLRKSINVLFQDFVIYAFSVRDNISLGRSLTDDYIMESLDKLSLKNKIENSLLGLNTPITSQLYENGIDFSGGERQKIAIARIYNNPSSFLILDEPTSNLDVISEYNLFNDILNEDSRFRTTIIISHRLTLTYKMDNIIVLDKGEVLEQGSHQDLLGNNSVYANMYKMQTEKYTESQKV